LSAIKPRQDLDPVSRRHDLGLDPRRREEQIGDRPVEILGGRQPHRRQTTRDVLLAARLTEAPAAS